MATSACAVKSPPTGRPLIGFVVGKYFAMHPDKTPDFNGIDRNIEEAVSWSDRLWEAQYLVFTAHLNTHHFEHKTRIDPNPLENEEYYRAFDRKLLIKAIDFIFATPNWRQSTGGRLEVQLACHLGIPVFESIADLNAWARGESLYSTVQYHGITEEAKKFGEGKDMKIALIDGPFWEQHGAEPDFPAISRHAHRAEEAAIALFNNKLGAFTAQLNVSYERLRRRIPPDRYNLLSDEMLKRVADCMLLTEGWEDVPEVRARVVAAQALGKPAFSSRNELLRWKDGKPDYCTVNIKP
jgi:hypothetical protein